MIWNRVVELAGRAIAQRACGKSHSTVSVIELNWTRRERGSLCNARHPARVLPCTTRDFQAFGDTLRRWRKWHEHAGGYTRMRLWDNTRSPPNRHRNRLRPQLSMAPLTIVHEQKNPGKQMPGNPKDIGLRKTPIKGDPASSWCSEGQNGSMMLRSPLCARVQVRHAVTEHRVR